MIGGSGSVPRGAAPWQARRRGCGIRAGIGLSIRDSPFVPRWRPGPLAGAAAATAAARSRRGQQDDAIGRVAPNGFDLRGRLRRRAEAGNQHDARDDPGVERAGDRDGQTGRPAGRRGSEQHPAEAVASTSRQGA